MVGTGLRLAGSGGSGQGQPGILEDPWDRSARPSLDPTAAAPGIGSAGRQPPPSEAETRTMNRFAPLFSAALFLAGSASELLAQTTFTSSNYPSCTQRPTSIRTVDVDGDGDLDLMTTHPGTDQTCIHLNDGSGVFVSAPQFFYATGSAPVESTAEQLDGLGLDDIAVVLNATAQLAIHLESGSGYAPPIFVGVDQGAFEVTALDLEGDGDLDLAVAANLPNVVSIVRNDGGGIFNWVASIPLPCVPTGIEAGDMNLDGRADLVLSGVGGPAPFAHAVVLTNTTVGPIPTFAPAQLFPVAPRPFGVTIADFNGDGVQDVATADAAFSETTVLLSNPFLIVGTTVGLAPTTYPLAPGLIAGPETEVDAADFDCDGDMDLVVACNSSSNVVCLWNNGAGVFSPAVPFPTGPGPNDVVVADFDGDCHIDIATSNGFFAGISVLLNDSLREKCSHDWKAGLADGFDPTFPGGGEESCPRPFLSAWFSPSPTRDFDGPVGCNRTLLHTFDGLPANLTSARLRMRMRADCPTSANDEVSLGLNTTAGVFVWSVPISTLTGTAWVGPDFGGVSLDLADLPGGVNLLPMMNADGFLDLRVGNDTAVDAVFLEMESCAPDPDEFVLTTSNFVTGSNFTWNASGAPVPGGFTLFWWSTDLGPGPILPSGQLCIVAPTYLGFGPTSASGNATLTIPVPPIVVPPCLKVSSQAIAFDASFTVFEQSNTVTQTIFD